MLRRRPVDISSSLQSAHETCHPHADKRNVLPADDGLMTNESSSNELPSPKLPSAQTLVPSASTLNKLWIFMPFCITAPLGKTRRVLPTASPTSYLNGLRGVACIVVFNQHVLNLLCHWSLRAYGTPGVAKNALQLPIVRVVYAGDGMVSLFFVLSGYVLGYSPLSMMAAKTPGDEFLARLSSSILRRGIRLFIPMLAFGFITAVVAWVLPWYEAPQPMNRWREHDENSLSAFRAHMSRFGIDALAGLDPFNFSWENGNPQGWSHCWTIPHEYRGSLTVYLSCLATCKLTSALRKVIFLALAFWFMCSPRHYWEMSCFFGGLFLAELRASNMSSTTQSQPWQSWLGLFSAVVRTSALLFSTVLLGWPVWGSTAQEPYLFLRRIIIPETWATDGYYPGDHTRRYIHNIGAFLMLWALDRLPWAQRLLTRSELVYLGEIGYSFSLLHWMVLYSFGRYLYSYLHYIGVYSKNGSLVVYIATLAVSLITADIFWRTIDEKSVRFAKWLVQDWLKVGPVGRTKVMRAD